MPRARPIDGRGDIHFHVAPLWEGFRSACGKVVEADQVSFTPPPERIGRVTCHWCLTAIEGIAAIFGEQHRARVAQLVQDRQIAYALARGDALLTPLQDRRARELGLLSEDSIVKDS